MSAKVGEKIHIIIRRRFEQDLRRHFIGEVIDAEETTIRLRGYAFTFDSGTNIFVRHSELRTRLFSLTDGIHVINVLPPAADIDKTHYIIAKNGKLSVTDETSFSLDINEFGANR